MNRTLPSLNETIRASIYGPSASGRGKHLFRGLIGLLKLVETLVGEIRNGAEGGSRTHTDYSQRILSPIASSGHVFNTSRHHLSPTFRNSPSTIDLREFRIVSQLFAELVLSRAARRPPASFNVSSSAKKSIENKRLDSRRVLSELHGDSTLREVFWFGPSYVQLPHSGVQGASI